MLQLFTPFKFLLVALAGWVNREQLEIIEYLEEENRVLKELLPKKRLLLNDDQRRRLAVKGKRLGREALAKIATLVRPETILAWHRRLIAQKFDSSRRRRGPGRPKAPNEVQELIVRMATENPTWGYTRIMGALANLGYEVSRGTIASILKEHGLDPRMSVARVRGGVTFSAPTGT
ncbi:MAG: helix-turn-helix domain-containing protein [Planctomycetota bacterium]